jgi:nicotinamide riboside transporter PnuC
MINSDSVIQFLIMVLSGAVVYFFSTKDKFKWGFIIGLINQPLWIYTTLKSGQWGMFLVSLWYVVMYIRGMNNHRKIKEHDA